MNKRERRTLGRFYEALDYLGNVHPPMNPADLKRHIQLTELAGETCRSLRFALASVMDGDLDGAAMDLDGIEERIKADRERPR